MNCSCVDWSDEKGGGDRRLTPILHCHQHGLQSGGTGLNTDTEYILFQPRMAPNHKRKISVDELQLHASPEKCWLLVNGAVWDLSEFAPKHPGGVDGKSQDPVA